MKIATFNINNIRKRLRNLISWLSDTKPDVVCLQELKATDNHFPESAIAAAGYSAVWRGQSAWNGVAILSRGRPPVLVCDCLPGDPADTQARYIEAAVDGILIGCLYAPNGNPQPGPKFAYKLAWTDRLIAHAAELRTAAICRPAPFPRSSIARESFWQGPSTMRSASARPPRDTCWGRSPKEAGASTRERPMKVS
jgi:exodeoxyribonuclease-3